MVGGGWGALKRALAAAPRIWHVAARTKRKLPLAVLIGAAAAAVVLLGVVVSLVTGKGSVKIELSDPNAKVEMKIDGKPIDIARLKGPLKLPVGEHALEIASGEFKPLARRFQVRRWSREIVKVSLERPEPPHTVAPFNTAEAREHQEAWARYLGVPVETANSIGMKFVIIPPGEFMMGSPDSESDAPSDEKPQHQVRITRPFSLAMHEVTVGQFRQFVSDTGYKGADEESDGSYTWQAPGWEQTDDHPVACVNWNDASEFCKWLSRKEGLSYRLPTEAEWEYACRAGTTSSYYFDDDSGSLGEHAWFGENADLKAQQAGQKKPNPFGLFDMYGNAWEWCGDWYGRDYYAVAPPDDPEGPASEVFRVRRGGSWESGASMVRSSFRAILRPDIRGNSCGFRLARTLAPASPVPAASPSAPRDAGGQIVPPDRPASGEQGFVSLFDGKTLAGWRASGSGRWEVIDGAIHGSITQAPKTWGHLVSDAEYGDFVLRLKFNVRGDSGVYVRGEEGEAWSTSGTQVQLHPPEDVGGLIEVPSRAGERGVRIESPDHPDQRYFRPGEWNELTIRVLGTEVRVQVNGVETAAWSSFAGRLKGRLAFQLWGACDTEVEFRDIEIREERP